MWYIDTMKYYYSAIKNNEVMKFALKWMELEKFISSKVSQMQNDIVWIHLYADISCYVNNQVIMHRTTEVMD